VRLIWPALIIGAVAMLFGRRHIVSVVRRHRLRSGHCLICGYDVRGIEGRCPECGAALNKGAQ
jgi:hypothetical protein